MLPPKLEPITPYQSFSSFYFILFYCFCLYVLRLLDTWYSDALPVLGAFLNSLVLYNMSIDLPLPSWLVDIFCLCFVRIYFWMFFSSLWGLRKILLSYFIYPRPFVDLQDFAPFFFLNVRFDALQKTFRLGNVSAGKKFDSFYQGDMTPFREFNRLFV